MLPRAIIFDLDGTLIDSAPDLADALNSVLRSEGLREQALADVKGMVGAGAKVLIQRGFAANGKALSEPEAERLLPAFIADYRARATDKTRLMPGAQRLLTELAAAGIGLGLCTNKPEDISRQILEDFAIASLFGSIVGGDTTPAKKPDPRPLLHSLAELRCAADEALMVGDSAADAGVARAAGTRLALVTFGYSQVPVRDMGADVLVEEFDAFLPALRGSVA